MTDADEGKSHVVGALIPTKMQPHFPKLPNPTIANPASAVAVDVEIVISSQSSRRVLASYQFRFDDLAQI